MRTRDNIIKKVFVETPVFDDDNKEIPGFSDAGMEIKKGTFSRTEKVNANIEADIYDVKARSYYNIKFRINQDILGIMELEYNTNPVVPFPRILGIAIRNKYRGKGYSKTIYAWIINRFGGVISDETLTGEDGYGSFNIWQWISSHFKTYIWKSKETTVLPINGPITSKMMNNRKDRFMSTKTEFDWKEYNKKFSKGVKLSKPILAPISNEPEKQLAETPEFNDKDKDLGDDETFGPPEFALFKLKFEVDIPGFGIGLIKLYQFASSKASKEITVTLGSGECVGVLAFDDDITEECPFPIVGFVVVKNIYRGKGISKIMYDFIVRRYKGLISDATLTGKEGVGSFQVWQSLSKKYNPYIFNRETGFITPSKPFTSVNMKSHEERLMVTRYPFDYERHNELHSEFPIGNVKFTGKALSETPELMGHDHSQVDISDSNPNEWDFTSGKKILEKNIGNGISFIKMKSQHSNDIKYALKDTKKNIILTGMRAKIDSSNYKVNPKEVQIQSVVTNPEYRNKGWGKLLYKMVLDTDGIIVSDYQLYPGTQSIWKNYLPTIAKMYNVNDDGDLEPFNFAKGTGPNGMYDYFVASKKKLL